MFIRFAATLAAGLLISSAQANQIGNQLTVHCTGSLGVTGIDGLSMICEGGDLSLFGLDGGIGTLNSDTGIDLFATGALDLERVTLSAPTIRLTGQHVMIGSQAVLNAKADVTVVGTERPVLLQPSLRDAYSWDRFNIGAAGSVELSSGSSAIDSGVFRVMPKQDASAIYGSLRASGDIVVVNNNGIALTTAGLDATYGGVMLSSAVSSAVPEPGSLALLSMGLLTITATRLRRRR